MGIYYVSYSLNIEEKDRFVEGINLSRKVSFDCL